MGRGELHEVVWTAKTESAVRSMRVVMHGVLPQDAEQVSSTPPAIGVAPAANRLII
jgi:hypothetical protein